MRKIAYLFILTLLVISCKKSINKEVGNPVLIYGSSSTSNLKSSLNSTANATEWLLASDKIGVYSDNATVGSGGASASNMALTAQGTLGSKSVNAIFSATPDLTWGLMSVAHNFWAYYPQAGLNTVPKTAVPITLPTVQAYNAATASNDVGAKDFLVATPVIKEVGDQSSVSFPFNHVFSIIRFNLSALLANDGNRFLDNIVLTGPVGSKLCLTGSNTIDLTSAPVGGIYSISGTFSNQITLNFATRQSLLSTSVFTCYIVMLPNVSNTGSYSAVGSYYKNQTGGITPLGTFTATGALNKSYLPGYIYDITLTGL